jgi:homoserine kinase
MKGLRRAAAFAPASVGNLGVGFDILGQSMPAIGDVVSVRRIDDPVVHIEGIDGIVTDLPVEAALNTAGFALIRLRERARLPFGIAARIEKGIPLKAGLGGSAASAVAAVVAANALLDEPFEPIELLKLAVQGEAVASGSLHADNIAPSLYGGLVLTVGIDDPQIRRIPVPPDVRCVVVHPELYVETREARRILKRDCSLEDVVWQTANLAGLITGCFLNDLDLIRASFEDVLIEPQRRVLIRGFDAVKQAARDAGALGCSISGSGPSVFAWTASDDARRARDAMVQAFEAAGVRAKGWIAPVESRGAHLLEERCAS